VDVRSPEYVLRVWSPEFVLPSSFSRLRPPEFDFQSLVLEFVLWSSVSERPNSLGCFSRNAYDVANRIARTVDLFSEVVFN